MDALWRLLGWRLKVQWQGPLDSSAATAYEGRRSVTYLLAPATR